MAEPAIVVDRLAKKFKGHLGIRTFVAVQELSFQVEAGGICGFLGPNGAGKTTTLKVLMDLIRPDGGSARIFGHAPGDRAAKQRLGFLPETPYFYDQLTGRELLQYFGRLRGVDPATLKRRSQALLETVGITYAADRRLRTYSKGMLQRIGMAQALIGDPELVVLDEPMTGLDPIGRSEFREVILQLKAEGKTVLFSSHILADAEALCDRVVIIHKGRLVQQATVAELLESAGARVRISLTGLEAGGWHAPHVPQSSPAGILTFIVPDHDAGGALLRRALEAGGRLLVYESLHPDLETVFLKKVGASS